MKNKTTCLLGIELYEISENFMYDLREDKKNKSMIFDILPKYTINNNTDKNTLIEANYFLQFRGFEKSDEKFLFFNVIPLSKEFENEIDNNGIDDIFKDIDFKKILSNFDKQTDKDLKHFNFPILHFLVVEIIYLSSYNHEDRREELYDIEYNIVGYLNNNFELKLFNHE